MADKPEKQSEAKKAPPVAEQQQAPVRPPVQIEDGQALTSYANFCRVTGTPEELIIDVGLNSQPVGPQTEAIKINQRLVMNYFTAKRLLGALQVSIQRHEAAFGVLETDIQKRVQPSAMARGT